jgi:hypothetical protein
LRFEVEAERIPAAMVSPFMPTHIEQPGSRHSKPAAVKMRSSPSASACALTRPEPATTSVGTTALRPRAMAAAARRSSMRPLVQEPMKTRLTSISESGVPGVRPMYFSARVLLSRRTGSSIAAGSGTRPSIGSASSGLVPQVTIGAMPETFTVTVFA